MIEKEIFLTLIDAMRFEREHDVEVINTEEIWMGEKSYRYILTFTKK